MHEPPAGDLRPVPALTGADQVRSVCRMCHGGCGALIGLRDGIPVSIDGDPASPASEGFFCHKGRASLELLHHPGRLLRPLLRQGDRHVALPWDEALDLAADRIRAQIAEAGAESVLFAQGTDRNYQEWVFRLANSIGSPNVLGPAHVCFYPRVMASILTCGGFTFCDYEGDPEIVLLWGSNKLQTHSDGVIGVKLGRALQKGTALIVVDPRATPQAKSARHWLQIRPGTDGALALGMLRLIIENEWYDRDFVEHFSEGFAPLRDHVRRYDLANVAALTGLEPQAIVEATRCYALAERACIEAGTGVSQNANAFSTLRSILMIGALCGNLDAPGGDLLWDPLPVDGRRSFPLTGALSQSQLGKRLGAEAHPVLGLSGWAHPDAVFDAIIDRKPYPVGALVNFGSNLLMAYADSTRTREALGQLRFHVSCELFMTPTAALANLVLPVSSWLERDQIVEFNAYIAARRKTVQLGECRSDEEIVIALAHRLGVGNKFWPDLTAALDHKLSGLKLDWNAFVRHGPIKAPKTYYKHRERGFRTRSGKFNLFHGGMPRLGGDALPTYRAPEAPAPGRYLLTSAHSTYFYNSEYRGLASLRKREPQPRAVMHPETAAEAKVAEGDWVRLSVVEGGEGPKFQVSLSDGVSRGVLFVSPSWWYPEIPGEESWRRSNVNLLTSRVGVGREMGTSNLRGFAVSLAKVFEG